MVNLKAVRESRGLTQAQLAQAVGCSQQAIHDYESCRSVPSAHTMLKIADALVKDPWYLMGLDPLSEAERKHLPPDAEEALFELLEDGLTLEEFREVLGVLRKLRGKP